MFKKVKMYGLKGGEIMTLKGNLQTTAMGILPHTDIDEAMRLALSVDIPFWPQLPKMSFFEDMYAQATEHFPGITVDEAAQKIYFDFEQFMEELPEFLEKAEEKATFALTEQYSLVYRSFLQQPGLEKYSAIRGQFIGPVSFGMKITDKDKKPIIYNDEVKVFLYDFMARKINIQYEELRERNKNAFVWVDEPGLEIIFGSFTGYSSEVAKNDYAAFLSQLEGPKGVHLCGNPDWSFLLNQNLDILSVDALGVGNIFSRYTAEIKAFLDRGGIIAWGIVPTLTEEVNRESVQSLVDHLEKLWNHLEQYGIEKKQVLQQAWLAPARCCLVNTDGAKSVEKAFDILKKAADELKDRYAKFFTE